jgi:hypothetical protein
MRQTPSLRARFFNRSLQSSDACLKMVDALSFPRHHPASIRSQRVRGFLLLTGRSNYRTLGDAIGLDLETDPDLMFELDVSLAISALFWSRQNVNQYADMNDIVGVTRRINGGLFGLEARTNGTAAMLDSFGLSLEAEALRAEVTN